MADAGDSKSPGAQLRAGSSPASGTCKINGLLIIKQTEGPFVFLFLVILSPFSPHFLSETNLKEGRTVIIPPPQQSVHLSLTAPQGTGFHKGLDPP